MRDSMVSAEQFDKISKHTNHDGENNFEDDDSPCLEDQAFIFLNNFYNMYNSKWNVLAQ